MTTKAEYTAAAEAIKEAIWMRNFINDLRIYPEIEKVPLFINNNVSLKLTWNPELHERTKYINIKFHFLRERIIEVRDLNTRRVKGSDNIADILTKGLSKIKHDHHYQGLRMKDFDEGMLLKDFGDMTLG